MGLPVSCDCGKSTQKRNSASVYVFGNGPATASSLVVKPSILCLVESGEDVGRPTVRLLTWLPSSLKTLGPLLLEAFVLAVPPT